MELRILLGSLGCEFCLGMLVLDISLGKVILVGDFSLARSGKKMLREDEG